MPELPYIPETVTVHLGAPDQPAQNVTVSFPDYIKNVASSEIYPTWPENAIRANIYAQISFALNRIFTEYYRSRGYDFDITNSTAYDQSFNYGRDIFENIGQIVDQIFADYIYRQGSVEPLFAQYCNGTTVQCAGLSQWGTVDLANQGLIPFDILQRYYGTDININTDTPIQALEESVPYRPLRPGDFGNDVRTIQIRLNRIATNYPSIPKIYPIDGVYSQQMEDSVREFQRIFDLTQDGVIGRATWYQILRIYNGVKRLNELNSEGLSLSDVSNQFPTELKLGDRGDYVRKFQNFLAVLGSNLSSIPEVGADGIFGPMTEEAVRAFQRTYGLPETGVVDERTWNDLYNVYRGIVTSQPDIYTASPAVPFPGYILTLGMQGNDVRLLQTYLLKVSETHPEIPPIEVDGVFGTATRNAVSAFQQMVGLPVNGQVNVLTWNLLASLYNDLIHSDFAAEGQFSGGTVG
ncbi:MAG: peptidoglycan-binding protein [Clostridia bacterium]|nr:peptidoglycan-binding protein [Clostridia bacterium]